MSRGSNFLIHRHKTAKPHFDLRLVMGDQVRCWSVLKEPVCHPGEKLLAIEREGLPLDEMNRASFNEEAFGQGKVLTWDSGEFTISAEGDGHLILEFRGAKLSGRYELRRMRWYPGNRWLLKNITKAAK